MMIEPFHIDDYEEVLAIWKSTNLYNPSSDTRGQITRMIGRNPETCIVMKAEEGIIGVLLGGFDGRRAYIHHLSVKPSKQNTGVGKALVIFVLSIFTDMKVPKVHLFVEKTTPEVVQFYKKLGAGVRNDLLMMSFVLGNQK